MLDSAVISPCGQHRYILQRAVDPKSCDPLSPPLVFGLCNPSTADATTDDATVRKCRGFARVLGYQRILIVNVFSFRSRHPKLLLERDDIQGPEWARWIDHAAASPGAKIIVGWGEAVPHTLRYFLHDFAVRLQGYSIDRRPLWCLGLTERKMPRHPLMLSYTTPLERYTGVFL